MEIQSRLRRFFVLARHAVAYSSPIRTAYMCCRVRLACLTRSAAQFRMKTA
jgi:hypothetical protein